MRAAPTSGEKSPQGRAGSGLLQLLRSVCTWFLVKLGDLDEVAAGIVKYSSCHRPHKHRWLRKLDAGRYKTFVLLVDVIDAEHRKRKSVCYKRLFEWSRGRMRIRL